MTDMELKARHVVDVYDDYSEHPCEECSQVYLKSEADKVIEDLEESHKKEVGQLLMEIVELKGKYNELAKLHDKAIQACCDADKVITHQKYKRCLAMAWWCESEEKRLEAITPLFATTKECWEYCSDYWKKWHNRWLKCAEKLKEAK